MSTKYHHYACYRLSTYLYVFVHVSVCARIQLEIHSPENANKITEVRALTCTTFHFIFNFLMLLFMMEKICLFSYGSGEINHGIAREIGASN